MNVLEIKSQDEIYAINSNLIYKIGKIPQITPLPLVDEKICGVCAIDGKIVVVVDFNKLFNKNIKNNSMVVVDIDGVLYALLVESVLDIKDVDYEEDDIDESVIGFYKTDEDVVQIIELNSVLQTISSFEYKRIEVDESKDEENIKSNAKYKQFILFKLQNEYFAIDVDLIKEIMFANLKITPLAGSDASIISVRDKSIKLIYLSKLFNLEFNKSIKNRILILQNNSKVLSFLIDEIVDIREFDITQIDSNDNEKISGIYKLDENIVSIINNEYIETLLDKYFIEEDEVDEKKEEDMREFVSFSIANEEYAIDIDYVEEVVKLNEITQVPEMKEYVKGVFNLRGDVIVVISLAKRLGFDENITSKSKILVVKKDDIKVGFLVDEINDVLSIKENEINASNSENLIKEIANIDNGKQIVLILNLDEIIDEEDIKFKEEK